MKLPKLRLHRSRHRIPSFDIKFLLLLLIIAAAATAVMASILFSDTPTALLGRHHTIELTKDGFSPKNITITSGDSVTFSSSTGEPFWPASDLHPSHGVFPDFDPKRALEPSERWTFQFIKSGEWGFHDHIAPFNTGTITVVEGDASERECEQGGIGCFKQQIEEVFLRDGLDASLDFLAQLYEANPQAAAECHTLSHDLGSLAYGEFFREGSIEVSRKTSFCNFGFYHGFMEALFTYTGSIEDARAFCTFTEEKLKDDAADASMQCFHGIGHGAIESADTTMWGSEEAMLAKAIPICESVSQSEDELFRCTSGIFNGIGNFYLSNTYNLTLNKEDPLHLCRQQEDTYKRACYENMTLALFSAADRDFREAIRVMQRTVEQDYKSSVIEYVASEHIRTHIIASKGAGMEESIALCREAGGALETSCLKGLVRGFLDQGAPNGEYEGAFVFCRLGSLSGEEQTTCFNESFSYIVHIYPRDTYTQICNRVESPHKERCLELV